MKSVILRSCTETKIFDIGLSSPYVNLLSRTLEVMETDFEKTVGRFSLLAS